MIDRFNGGDGGVFSFGLNELKASRLRKADASFYNDLIHIIYIYQ